MDSEVNTMIRTEIEYYGKYQQFLKLVDREDISQEEETYFLELILQLNDYDSKRSL